MQDVGYCDGHGDGTTNPLRDLESVRRCYDCGGRVEWYWMHNDLWASAVPEDRLAWICIRCISQRLGRQLAEADLTDTPVNQKLMLLERLAIPYGICQCGKCGQKTKIATKTNFAQGQIKGQPNRYLAGHRAPGHIDYLAEDRGYSTPCWIWQGAKDWDGYGLLKRGGYAGPAHCWYYRKLVGPISDEMTLDHLCRVRDCVNPAHVEPVPHGVNVLRGTSFSAMNAAKTHCERGHEFTPENTYRHPSGRRTCKACRRATYHRRKARLAEPEPGQP